MGQFRLEPPSKNMSTHLHILVGLLVVFDPSYAATFTFLDQPSTGDIVEQTRTMADTLKNTLRSLASKPEAAPILKKVFAGNNSDCIVNMDQAIEAIETSTRLFENAGTEMKFLIKAVQGFQNIKETPKAVRETAKILRLLDVLIPKLTPSTVCQTTSGDVLGSMHSLGALVSELAYKDDLHYSTHGRQTLQTSAQILSKVTKFLTKESNFKFDHFCTKDLRYNKAFFTAVGNMMGDLADLYTDLGGLTTARELINHKDFTRKVVASINKLGDLDLVTLGCSTPGSSELVANTLDDLAAVIEDVGLTTLCKQIGLSTADCAF